MVAGSQKYLTESLDVIPDPGSAEATPELRLIARNHGLSSQLFDLLHDFQGADATAAQEDRIGVRTVDLPGE